MNTQDIKDRVIVLGKDPWYFLKHCVRTQDNTEQDQSKRIKSAPMHLDYITDIVTQWKKNNLLLVDKSRRMWMTWLFVSLHLHETFTKPYSNTFFRSQYFEDADDLVKKALFVYESIPEEIWPKSLRPSVKIKEGQLYFPEVESYIYAVASGASKMRSRTSSSILFDEFAFQEDGREAYMAAKPTIQGGGRISIVSTNPWLFGAERPFFHDLIDDSI